MLFFFVKKFYIIFFSTRVRWSPLVRSQLLKTPDHKLPCQIMIVAVGAAAAGRYIFMSQTFYVMTLLLFSG